MVNKRSEDGKFKVPTLRNIELTEREVDDIVAFMKTLTDGWQPAISKS